MELINIKQTITKAEAKSRPPITFIGLSSNLFTASSGIPKKK